MKPPAFLHVDLDGSWCLLRHFGHPYDPAGSDVLFYDGLPRLLRLFAEEEVQATLFVVGRDLEIPGKRDLLREAVRSGHRIASHTMSHPEGFAAFDSDAAREEVLAADTLLREHLAVDPVGFRAPNFEVCAGALRALEQAGYAYDGSVIGTSVAPLLKVYHGLRRGDVTGSGYLGGLASLGAPRRPYHPRPDRWFEAADGTLWEFPVATLPWLRLPIHGSYQRVLGRFGPPLLGASARWYAARGIPFTYLLHLSDVAPRDREGPLRDEPGNHLSDEERLDLARRAIRALKERFTITTTEAFLGTHLHVVAGVLRQGDEVLLAQRPPGKPRPLQWEFPGGKVEAEESPPAALGRELEEELGVSVEVGERLGFVEHRYEDLRIRLEFLECTLTSGTPEPRDCHAIQWMPPSRLVDVDLSEADRRAIAVLGLGTG